MNKANQKGFITIRSCELCGNSHPKQFIDLEDLNHKTGKYTYVICPKCSLIWLSPRPNQKIISKYYPKIYSAHKKIKKINILQKIIRNIIKNNRLVAKNLIKDQLFFFEKKGKILDVGTGNGSYMHVLKTWGWDVYGTEPNPNAFKNAKRSGLKKIKLGNLLQAKYKSNFFDVVRFSHVLEHVPSPKIELQESKRILKVDGRIIILIPNINSLSFKIFKSRWQLMDPPRHFFQFSPLTIKKLLKKEGFKKVQIKYNQSPYSILRSIFFTLGLSYSEKRFGFFIYPLGILAKSLNMLHQADVIEVSATVNKIS